LVGTPGYTIPTNNCRGYALTWGEFDFRLTINSGWSGFDVSAITIQVANIYVQGMKTCDIVSETCSYIALNAIVLIMPTHLMIEVDRIGGNLLAGPIRLIVMLGYGVNRALE
jgi:hypothetical protein